jgi:hypothetical protein
VLEAGKDGGVKKLRLNDGAFIYTIPPTPPARRPIVTSPCEHVGEGRENHGQSALVQYAEEHSVEHRGTEHGRVEKQDDHQHEEQQEEHMGEPREEKANHLAFINLPAQIAQLPNSSAFERGLLDHFVHSASGATSCHKLVQEDVCRMVLPMAMGSPALLSATLVLSAIHQKTLNHPVQAMIANQKIAGLKTASLRDLRRILAQPQRQDLNVILATVRTLCLAEIYDGDYRTKYWRAHFDGARALLDAQPTLSQNTNNNGQPADFLRRWFSVTEGLIALTPDSIPTRMEEVANDGPMICLSLTTDNTTDGDHGFLPSTIHLDEYTGCSTDLSGLFCDIGFAIRTHQSEHGFAQNRTCSDYHCSMTAARLERRTRDVITQDQVGKIVFHPKTASKLSCRQALEFTLCNRAYQYSALLNIQRRLFDLPAAHHEVQEVVRMIIGCVEGVHPAEGLSPLAVLTTPVFVAGCEAFGHDRARVRKLLDVMYTFLRIPNMRQALEMLEKYWASARLGQPLGWAQFAKLHEYDFLPY